MNEALIRKLQEISPEEQKYLEGDCIVKRDIYTDGYKFEIDRKRFLEEGKLITVRPHSRFVEFPIHSHNYIEIMYVCKGTITHCIDNEELVMEKGDMLLLNQYTKHRVRQAEYDDVGINFIALPEFFDIPLKMLDEKNILAEFLIGILSQRHTEKQYMLFNLGDSKPIENLMENMISSIENKNNGYDTINQYSMGLVFLYILNHLDSLTAKSSQSYKEVVLKATRQYINTMYKTATLTRLAENFNISVSALSKLVKQEAGCTFQELLQRKRFQKSKELLSTTELPVEEISRIVGYENYSFFNRQFKYRYGVTPGRYRKEYKLSNKKQT